MYLCVCKEGVVGGSVVWDPSVTCGASARRMEATRFSKGQTNRVFFYVSSPELMIN